jgi:hypothetical protein
MERRLATGQIEKQATLGAVTVDKLGNVKDLCGPAELTT